ncbi:MAG: T9SS type A sorting domain-containing protein [Candidatus Eisenbacteria bacterium]|uniref:T9SS type A sorting domain-containing protein n=1 Tax=Eiseniibacteriota bacterium TaxID=2212470 RepID=A0A933SDN4_UNCEI|nr:T9SS type A sorting domain-containing protein [Candidatus Eisenbacteria bacterium]
MLIRNALMRYTRAIVCLLVPAALGAAALTTTAAAIDVPDGYWTELAFAPRQGQTAVFDPARNRVIVFGGEDVSGFHNDVWAFTLDGTPHWTQLVPQGTPPEPRTQHCAVFDPLGNRLIVFGGRSGVGYLSDTWELSLNGQPVWSQMAPAGAPPGARHSASAAYDSRRHAMIVSGGVDGFSTRNEIYILSLEGVLRWTLKPQSAGGPAARRNHVSVYDNVADRLVISGGYAGGDSADTWALPIEGQPVWKRLATSGPWPVGRERHTGVYDALTRRLVIFGGRSVATTLNDAWALPLTDGATWEPIAVSGNAGVPRHTHSGVLDAANNQLVVLAGVNGTTVRNDVQALSLGASHEWTTLAPDDSLPPPRSGAAMAFDGAAQRLFVTGGADAVTTTLDDLWRWGESPRADWQPLVPAVTPGARRHAASVWDAARGRMLLMGGDEPQGPVPADLWALSGVAPFEWTQLPTIGPGPSERSGHALVWDTTRDRLLLFGGRDGSGLALADLWELPLAGALQWAPIATSGAVPAARDLAAAAYDAERDQLVLFGGRGAAGQALADAWVLPLGGAMEWSALNPTGAAPAARYGPAYAFDASRDRLVIFGGGETAAWLADGWELTLSGAPAWRALASLGVTPAARREASAVFDVAGDRLLLFGGSSYATRLGDLWQLEFSRVLDADGGPAVARVSALRAPAPNPARGMTTLRWSLARAGHVRLGVYDLSGRLVRTLADGERAAGEHAIEWDGRDDSRAMREAGVYFVRLEAEGVRETRKIVRVR